MPGLVLLAFLPLGVLMGSLGIDVHINSKVGFSVLVFFLVAGLCASVMTGIRLIRNETVDV